jgi:predicted ABC-class ATPase
VLPKNIKIKIYGTVILPVALYGFENWSLILREKRRLWLFENRVLRRIFGPKKDDVTVKFRKLHNEEHNDLSSLGDKIEKNAMRRTCSIYGKR